MNIKIINKSIEPQEEISLGKVYGLFSLNWDAANSGYNAVPIIGYSSNTEHHLFMAGHGGCARFDENLNLLVKNPASALTMFLRGIII